MGKYKPLIKWGMIVEDVLYKMDSDKHTKKEYEAWLKALGGKK
jgi:hypothetical protein